MYTAATMNHLQIEGHRQAIFGLCYRMTGSAADAEDLVQETFRLALERPPTDLQRPLRPWLLRVATNLSIDSLRRRKRERYFGPWLPSPVGTDRLLASAEQGPEARYEVLESATSAFLLALEVLTPRERAVLVLRDVLDMTGPETALAVDVSPGHVRVILHRARTRLRAHRQDRAPITAAVRDRTGRRLRELVVRLGIGDLEGVRRLLADDVTSVHDGGGEFTAAVRVLRGVQDVMRLYENIAAQTPLPAAMRMADLNGLPALLITYPPRPGALPRNVAVWVELDRAQDIVAIRGVVASAKLNAVRFPGR